VTETAPDKPTCEALERTKEELEGVRKRLEGVTEMARLAYWEHDFINDIYTFNDQFYRLLHTTAEQVGGYTMPSEEYARRFIHPDDLPAILAQMQKTFDSGYSRPDRQIEHRIIYPDGGTGHVAVTFFMVTDLEGKPARAYGVTRDITEQKQAEASLKEEIALRRILVDQSKDGIVTLDMSGAVIESNQQFAHMLGYSLKEAQKLHVWDWDAVSTREKLLERLRTVGQTGVHHETRHRRKDGSLFDVEISANSVNYQGRQLLFAVHRDITARKQAERERLANLYHFENMDKINRAVQGTDNLKQMMEDVLDAVLTCYDSDRAYLLFPCDPDAKTWTVPMERNKPEYPGVYSLGGEMPTNKAMARLIRTALESNRPLSLGAEGDLPDPGDPVEGIHVQSSIAMALRPKAGKPWLFGIHQCSHPRLWTTEEKKLFQEIGRRLEDALTSLLMHRNLRKSEDFLSNILAYIPDSIVVKDAEELRIVSFNRAFQKLTGFPEEKLVGKRTIDLVPEKLARKWDEADRAVLDNGVPVDIPEETIQGPEGELRIIHTQKIPIPDETGKPKFLLIIGEDITDYKKLQGQLNQAQKMEALGAMSGGIAHDFNNILQPMIGYCEFLKEDLPAHSPQHTYVDGIFQSGLRARDLVNQILAFSRQSDRKPVPVGLPLLLKEALKLCRSTFSASIEIIRDIQQDCAPVMADPTQLHQIIMNLMVNAYHAVEETGGKITVRLRETQLAEEDLRGSPLPPGKYARLSISDTGCGIAPDVMEKIFDPYFTTKPQGKGTGLGLSVVYGIVKEHGGHINVYSEVGKGTTFNVYLPGTEKASDTLPAAKAAPPLTTGHEHILLVDDEAIIIELERHMLERLGYRVTSCPDGTEALATFSETPGAFDLVITDINMPNMTGDQLARKIMAIRPEIPIIICTGFSEKIGLEEARAIGVKDFLMKPVAKSELAQKVRKALDQALP
jgi:PAS domain S-box-containing protein